MAMPAATRYESLPAGTGAEPMGREEKTKTEPNELDLRGVPCPLSWAKAKVRLEALPRGAMLVVLLDDPRGVRDLPRAAEAEGYAVDGPTTGDGATWRLVIQV